MQLHSNQQAPALDEIRASLGEPAFSAPGILLYHGDCVELLSRLPARSIDLTITSPPYNIGKAYERPLPVRDYLDWCGKWSELIHQVTRDTGAFWLNLGYISLPDRANAVPLPYLLWDRIPFFLMQEIVWNYGAGVACRMSFSPRNEKFLWYVKNADKYTFNLDDVRDPDVKYPNQMKNGKLKCNPLGKNPSDVWQVPKVTSGTNRSSTERTPHPAQFPAALIERIVKVSSNKDDVLLEPFAGSGTTLEVAARNGRAVVGFEINADYITLASKRIMAYYESVTRDNAQSSLF